MTQLEMNYIILWLALIFNGTGCVFILRKNVLRYGIVLIISLILSASLCLLFYWLDFYRFDLPLVYVLPVVSISFSFLAFLTINFRPKRRTFPFFFFTLTLVFTIEVVLRNYFGFIKFRNGWDYWDSYSLYWVYIRIFDHIGEFFVPFTYRSPIKSDTKLYWTIFLLTIVYGAVGGYILSKGWTH